MQKINSGKVLLIALALACLFSVPPAQAALSWDSYGSPSDQPEPDLPCGQHPLSNFAVNPCNHTRNERNLNYAKKHYGGEQFADYLKKWWEEDFLPALMKMTAQLHASRLDSTRQIGTMLDAQATIDLGTTEQEQELQAQTNGIPTELSCTANSYQSAMAQSASVGNAMSYGLKKDVAQLAANAPGTMTEGGPVADQKLRWDEYCAEFHDPDANNGVSACADTPDPEGIVNGDIDIESFLLKDTIDTSNPHEYKAARALLRNLVQPHIRPRVPDSAVNSVAGKEWILMQQHVESARAIAADVVSSIISRRSSIPNSTAGVTLGGLRSKAGIEDSRIATNPSYNEIMLAMTKERFYDPQYFINLQDQTGALKQERASLNAYITMQYQDIYKLQEQINALLAARASLKYGADAKPSQVNYNPIQSAD